VVRHSGSSTAVVRMERAGDEMMLQVQDFGCGMTPAQESHGDALELVGVGIPSMRERLRRIDGHLDIQSNNEGTVVCAFVPAPARDDSAIMS